MEAAIYARVTLIGGNGGLHGRLGADTLAASLLARAPRTARRRVGPQVGGIRALTMVAREAGRLDGRTRPVRETA